MIFVGAARQSCATLKGDKFFPTKYLSLQREVLNKKKTLLSSIDLGFDIPSWIKKQVLVWPPKTQGKES